MRNAKEPKSKKTEVEEIFEEDIINEDSNEYMQEQPFHEEVAPRPLTQKEQAEIKALREQRYTRFAQLAGLEERESPKLEESEQDIPMKMVRPSKIRLTLLSEGLRKEVKQLMKEGRTKMSQFPDEIRRMISEEMGAYSAPMEELGMPAFRTASNPDQALDSFAAKLSFSVKNAITKHLGLEDNGADMPYKADYIVDALIKNLKNPLKQ